jgi:GTPase SAR1 family protein
MLDLADVNARPEYIALRDQMIKTAEAFLLVFSITSRRSFELISTLREEVLQIKELESVPMMVVGTKCDLEEERAVAKTGMLSELDPRE